ncbi:MAG: PIN domain nuclease, partial [Chloroflexota bacterium]
MSTDFVVRLIGMFIFGIAGAYFGNYLGADLFQVPQIKQPLYPPVIGFLGALFGLVLSPYITTRPMRYLRSLVKRIDARTLVAALVGLIAGLVVAALLSFPISLLPKPLGEVLPFFAVILLSYFGIAVFVMRQHDIFSVLSSRLSQRKTNIDDQQ